MRIGLDFDGVFADCNQLKSDVAKDMYGVDIDPAQYEKAYIFEHDLLTVEQERRVREAAYGDPRYALHMDPVPGAFDHVAQLADDGHDITVITSRSGDLLELAEEWFDRQADTSDLPDLHFHGVGYGNEKADACEQYDVDAFVDDDLHKLEPLQDTVPHRYFFAGAYSDPAIDTTVATPVTSWAELYEELAALA